MERPYPQNPFPPPPRRIGATLLFFSVAAVALAGCGYLIWTLVVGDRLPPPPLSPVPTAAAQSEIATIIAQLRVFQSRAGRYPTAGEGLEALVQRPVGVPADAIWPKLWQSVPRDPWGRTYEYVEVPGDPPGYRVFSKGSNANDAGDDISGQVPPASSPPSSPPPAAPPAVPRFR